VAYALYSVVPSSASHSSFGGCAQRRRAAVA
jgi:hypothetical protein